MLTKSAKAKGRLLQNWVRELILDVFVTFDVDEVRTALMGESGTDIKLSLNALDVFPYKIECKSQKKGFSSVYDAYEQCQKHKEQGEPLVFIKQNRKNPLVVVDAKYFIEKLKHW